MFSFKSIDYKSLVSFNFFIKDKIIWIADLISLVLNIFLWILLYIKIPRGEIISLHYNIYFGIDKIGNWYEIFIYPFTGLFILVVNFFLAYLIYKKAKFLSYFLTIATAVVSFIILGAGFLILSINI